MWVIELSFKAIARVKERKRKEVFSIKVRSIDLASLVEAVYLNVSYSSSSSVWFRGCQPLHGPICQVEPALAVRCVSEVQVPEVWLPSRLWGGSGIIPSKEIQGQYLFLIIPHQKGERKLETLVLSHSQICEETRIQDLVLVYRYKTKHQRQQD